MALKWLFFSKKIARIAPGLHRGNLFFRTQRSQPTTFKTVIAGFLNKQMLQQNATITAKPCLITIVHFHG